MTCTEIRDAISAALDGDETLAPDVVTAHLDTCSGCRTWQEQAHALTRSVRLALAEDVPDLTEPILASFAPARPVPLSSWRIALVVVAVIQLALAVPTLLEPLHLAREVGSWDVALAVGFLCAAWAPARADGLLPLVAALVGCLVLTSVFDVLAGRTPVLGESVHALALAGLVFLAMLRATAPRPRR